MTDSHTPDPLTPDPLTPDLADAELPPETLAALAGAWRTLPAPPLARELPEEDEATQRAVGWLAAAWRQPAVLAPSAAAQERARFAVRGAARRAAPHAGRPAHAPIAGRAGWQRQVAAAAVLLLLLGAALFLEDRVSPRRGSGAIDGAVADAGAPTVPAQRVPVPPIAPLLAAGPELVRDALPVRHTASAGPGAPPLIELRSGQVRLILLTDTSRHVPENLP